MPSWTIEFVSRGSPTEPDPDPAWTLGPALAARGHRVRILYPGPPDPSAQNLAGVTVLPVAPPASRARPLAFERTAGMLAEANADFWVGAAAALGVRDLPKSGRPALIVVEPDAPAVPPPAPAPAGLGARVREWFAGRTRSKVEEKALSRASRILVPSDPAPSAQAGRRAKPSGRFLVIPQGVPDPVATAPRGQARLALKIPADVPVVAVVGRSLAEDGVDRALESFRRVRVFFPGVRCIVVGMSVPSEPGVSSVADPDVAVRAQAFTAADVLLAPARSAGTTPWVKAAMRYGLPPIVSRSVVLAGVEPKKAARIVPTDEAGDFASELAELLADPALRRAIGEAARQYADGFSPARLAEKFELALAPAA